MIDNHIAVNIMRTIVGVMHAEPSKEVCRCMSSHIHNWRSARQPAIPSSNAEGDRKLACIYFSKGLSTLAKILKSLQAGRDSKLLSIASPLDEDESIVTNL